MNSALIFTVYPNLKTFDFVFEVDKKQALDLESALSSLSYTFRKGQNFSFCKKMRQMVWVRNPHPERIFLQT